MSPRARPSRKAAPKAVRLAPEHRQALRALERASDALGAARGAGADVPADRLWWAAQRLLTAWQALLYGLDTESATIPSREAREELESFEAERVMVPVDTA
jgi:hypothetical protein